MKREVKIQQLLERMNYILSKCGEEENGLLGGNAGLVLYCYYQSRILNEQEMTDTGTELLEHIFECLNSEDMGFIGAPMSNGVCGFGLLMNHLVVEGFLDFDLEENMEVIDQYLLDAALKWAKKGKVDFLHEAGGILHYFVTKPDVSKHVESIEQLIDAIDHSAVEDELGWRIVGSIGPQKGLCYDLSIAHGLCGLLLILMKVHQKGIKQDRIAHIVKEGIKFISRFQRDTSSCNELSLFPQLVDIYNIRPDYSNRLAWCYGDFGPLMVMATAAKIWKTPELEDNVEFIANHICERLDPNKNLVQDAHFCHGAAGVAQCFRALNRLVPNDKAVKAYDTWLGHTIQLLDRDLSNKTYLGKEIGLLEGMVGVGLVLQQALSPVDTRWDDMLLL